MKCIVLLGPGAFSFGVIVKIKKVFDIKMLEQLFMKQIFALW